MKNLFYSFFAIFLFSGSAWAQLSGDRAVPSDDYPNLQTVADSLNLYGVGAGGVNFMIAGGSSFEETPIEFTATGTADDGVYIGWNGEGDKPTVNFDGTSGDSEAGITLVGADYYTIDGIAITNSNSNLEYGILIANLDNENGSQNNTVKNVEITLDKLNTNQTVGIGVVAVIEPVSFDGNNHNNKFYNNHITNVMIGYFLDGNTSTTSLMSVGNEVDIEDGGESIISDLVMAGVTASDQHGFNFSNTTIRDLTRIGDGSTAPAAIATSSGNPSDPLTNEFIISNNTIEDLTSDFTSVFGMYLSARKVTYHVSNNKIHNVTATGGGNNTADGIMVLASTTIVNIYNNMVSGIAAPASSAGSNAATRGITVRTYDQANVFYNTVVLDFEVTNPDQKSAAFVIYNNGDPVLFRNNIFINKATMPVDATGIATAVLKRNNSFDNIMEGSDNNLLYAGVPGATHPVFYGHSSSAPNLQETLADYIAAAVTFDQNAQTEDVQFVAVNDLHIPASANSIAKDNASPITEPIEVSTDFDGTLRDTETPDIGADEIMAALLPDVAINPNPADGATDVSASLGALAWEYSNNSEFANPEAFLLYLGQSPDFDGVAPTATVTWVDGQTDYAEEIGTLDYETVYYWQVVPTTAIVGGEVPAAVEVWSFTTEAFVFGYPNPAINPTPANNGQAVSNTDNAITLEWDYIPATSHSLPVHFEIYATTDFGNTDWETPVGQVDYEEGVTAYELDLVNSPNFSYVMGEDNYWKVVPVSATDESTPDVPVWNFSFDGTIGLEDIALEGTLIYPNPATDFVNIAPSFTGKYEAVLYDVQGRIVQNFGDLEGVRRLDVSGVQTGAYQLVITQGEGRFVSLVKVK